MYQIIEQTDEEKLAMYMKLSKRQLAEMLLNANKVKSEPILMFKPIEYWSYGMDSGSVISDKKYFYGKEWK